MYINFKKYIFSSFAFLSLNYYEKVCIHFTINCVFYFKVWSIFHTRYKHIFKNYTPREIEYAIFGLLSIYSIVYEI